MARLVALGLLTPRRDRVRVTLTGLAFTTAVRVIDGVHDDTANRRPDTEPALRTGLADLAQVVLIVADFADRGAAVHVDLAHFARTHARRDVLAFAGDDLDTGTSAARDLRTLAGLHLDAVHD